MSGHVFQSRRNWRHAGVVAVAIGLAYLAAVGVATALADAYNSEVQYNSTIPNATALGDLALARRLRPDLSGSWRLSAGIEATRNPAAARALILHALALNPSNWRNWQQLGMIDFQLGQITAARHDLKRAARVSSGFAVHYDLANAALVMGDQGMFWRQMQLALRIAPPSQVQPTLQDIVRLAPDDPRRLAAILPHGRTNVAQSAIEYLVSERHWATAQQVWNTMRCDGYRMPLCRNAALVLTDGWLDAAQDETANHGGLRQPTARGSAPAQALAVWNSAIARGALHARPALPGVVTDPGFTHGWEDRGFFWHGADEVGSDISVSHAGPSVEVKFDGFEPETATLFWQWVATEPNGNFSLSVTARGGGGLVNAKGLRAELTAVGGRVVATVPVRLGPSWETSAVRFRLPLGASLLALALEYRRPLGEALLEGNVWIKDPKIAPVSAQP